MKQVNDKIDEVEQHPLTARQALHVMRAMSPALQRFHHSLSDSADVGVGGARGYDEKVGRIAKSAQVEHHRMYGFQVVDRLERQVERLRYPGRGPAHAASST
jgi:hypothetical protein